MASPHALSESKMRRFGASLMHIAYNLYILGTIAFVFYTFFSQEPITKDLWISRTLYLAVAVLLALMLCFLTFFAVSFSRKARYAEVMHNMHEIQHDLRDLQTKVRARYASLGPKPDKDTLTSVHKFIAEEFQKILTSIATGFSLVSAVNCRSSIKILGKVDSSKDGSPDNLYVKTLARDLASARDCIDKDGSEQKNHLVTKNTDFELLVKEVRRFFFSGDVSTEGNYLNSSEEHWRKSRPLSEYASRIPLISKLFASPYPYRSSMVFPIKGSLFGGTEVPLFLGFLCIDSKSRNSFSSRYDSNLGAALADSIYHVLREYFLLMVRFQVEHQGSL